MATALRDKIKSLPPHQRKEVEVLAAKLIAGEYVRCEAKHACIPLYDESMNNTTSTEMFEQPNIKVVAES